MWVLSCPKEYTDAVVRDPQIISLRDRVNAVPEEAVAEDEAFATITLQGGRKLTKHIEHAIGSLERPMSNADLEAKFRGLADGVLSTEETERLMSLCWAIQSSSDVSEIARASVPA